MTSPRLRYEPIHPDQLDAFHTLVEDEHVRRYLMDGKIFDRQWSAERIRDSQDLFRRRCVGLWLAYEKTKDDLAGFCGFLELPEVHPEPQIVYALFEHYTGSGFATEMARACIDHALSQNFGEVIAGVDEVNTASVRILKKLGFEQISTWQGAFGNSLLLRLTPIHEDMQS